MTCSKSKICGNMLRDVSSFSATMGSFAEEQFSIDSPAPMNARLSPSIYYWDLILTKVLALNTSERMNDQQPTDFWLNSSFSSEEGYAVAKIALWGCLAMEKVLIRHLKGMNVYGQL